MTEAWSEWEGRVVNGEFRLLKYLGGSDQSAVFLTELQRPRPVQAAIKLIPADSSPDLRLSRWQMVKGLAHPHLIRLFDAGRCQIEASDLLFVVMEYAEENLAQIVPERALTAAEAREVLNPALDALTWLHDRGLVHGGLKPANILAINDQLKLASDDISAAGDTTSPAAKPSAYTAPEIANTGGSSAADVWSLGMTLAEILTQNVPTWSGPQQHGDPELPTNLPEPFADIVRDCLRRDPAQRCTIADISARLRSKLDPAPVFPPPTTESPAQPLPVQPQPPVTVPPQPGMKRSFFGPAVVAFVVVLAILISWRPLHQRSNGEQSPSQTSQPATKVGNQQTGSGISQPESASRSKPSPVKSRSDTKSAAPAPAPSNTRSSPPAAVPVPVQGEVVHQVLPDIPQAARDTIQGTIRVGVKVQVDRSGNVTGAELDSPGPSQYFARLSLQAAHGWKFAPGNQDNRAFIVRFQFTNQSTRAEAIGNRP